jgi:putative transposase
MSHALIGSLKKKAIPVSQACRVLNVSRSGYYSATKSSLAAPKVCAASVHLKAAIAVAGHHYWTSPGAQPDASQPAALGLET